MLTPPPVPALQVQQVALGGLLQKLVAVFIAGIPLVVVGGLMYAFIAQEDVMAGFLVSVCKLRRPTWYRDGRLPGDVRWPERLKPPDDAHDHACFFRTDSVSKPSMCVSRLQYHTLMWHCGAGDLWRPVSYTRYV